MRSLSCYAFIKAFFYNIINSIERGPLILLLCLTISNLFLIYIVYLSIWNQKVSFLVQIKLMYEFIKKNPYICLAFWFVFVLISIVFRHPVLIYLGLNTPNNFYLYLFVMMLSTLLPINYTINILIKNWYKKMIFYL